MKTIRSSGELTANFALSPSGGPLRPGDRTGDGPTDAGHPEHGLPWSGSDHGGSNLVPSPRRERLGGRK